MEGKDCELIEGILAQTKIHQEQQVQRTKVEIYQELLVNAGYRPAIDEDGDVTFRAEGFYFVLYSNEADAEYFQLVLPNVWRFEAVDTPQILKVANRVTREFKFTKVVVLDNNAVWVAAELLFSKPRDAEVMLRRTVDTMLTARRNFVDEVAQEPEKLISGHLGMH